MRQSNHVECTGIKRPSKVLKNDFRKLNVVFFLKNLHDIFPFIKVILINILNNIPLLSERHISLNVNVYNNKR